MKQFDLIIFFLENAMSSMTSTINETEMIEALAKEAYSHMSINDAIEMVKQELKEINYFKRNQKVYKVVKEHENIFIVNVDDGLAQKIPDSSIYIFKNKNNSQKCS
jgi:reverse gyrase